MGKSVFLMPPRDARDRKAQLRKLRDELGPGLKLEGPFADMGGVIADMAADVRRITRSSCGRTEMQMAVSVLLPHNTVPENEKASREHLLEIPFFVGMPATGWFDYPEGAGAAASTQPLEFDSMLGRPLSAEQLSLVGVSLFRALGIECYYTIYHPDMSAQLKMAEPGDPVVSVILVPGPDGAKIVSVVPRQANPLLNLEYTSMEVLDDNAVLSLIKFENATCHSNTLMADFLARREFLAGETILRSVQAGHAFHEASMLWTMDDVRSDMSHARAVFGAQRMSKSTSTREQMETGLLHVAECRLCMARMSAMAMLHEDIKRALLEYIDMQHGTSLTALYATKDGPGVRLDMSHEMDIAAMVKGLGAMSGHPSVALWREYLESTSIMREHIHALSECSGRSQSAIS